MAVSSEAYPAIPAGPGDPAPESRPLGLMEIASAARGIIAFFTELPVDQVAACIATDSGWTVTVDVVEAAARIGGNDLLASYEVRLDAGGTAMRIERVRRYNREDKGAR